MMAPFEAIARTLYETYRANGGEAVLVPWDKLPSDQLSFWEHKAQRMLTLMDRSSHGRWHARSFPQWVIHREHRHPAHH